MAAPSVRSRHEGGVATVMIDREAKRNALDRETLAGLEAALEAAARNPEVRVIVLRGAGDRVFCAGADLAEIQGHESIEASRHHFDGVEYQTSMRYLREMIVLTSRTEDAQEGIRAFFEKRKPTWTGR
jgi:enoyl-CoA hydratase/carnithine racemase